MEITLFCQDQEQVLKEVVKNSLGNLLYIFSVLWEYWDAVQIDKDKLV